ncbi:MAG: hypothetical protein ACE5EK_00055 [Nitrospinales bacterium]
MRERISILRSTIIENFLRSARCEMIPVPFAQARRFLGCLYLLYIIVVSLIPNPPNPDPTPSGMFEHFGAYFVLMAWFGSLYPESTFAGFSMTFILLGVVLEVLQEFTGYRAFEWVDIAANSTGVLAGWGWAYRGRRPNHLA